MEGGITDKTVVFSRLNGYSFEQRKIIHLLFDQRLSLEDIAKQAKLSKQDVLTLLEPLVRGGIVGKRPIR